MYFLQRILNLTLSCNKNNIIIIHIINNSMNKYNNHHFANHPILNKTNLMTITSQNPPHLLLYLNQSNRGHFTFINIRSQTHLFINQVYMNKMKYKIHYQRENKQLSNNQILQIFFILQISPSKEHLLVHLEEDNTSFHLLLISI